MDLFRLIVAVEHAGCGVAAKRDGLFFDLPIEDP